MKYFFIAGEASGDLHASHVMRELKRRDPEAEFRFMGGDLMAGEAPGQLLHYRETSYMMLDVLFHLRRILRNLKRIRTAIRLWSPDVVIPVDYPGFNLRIAAFAHSVGIPVFYFISPKVWAWKKNRIRRLRAYVTKLFVILPFEVEFFRDHGMQVEYHGNPLVDAVARFREQFQGDGQWKQGKGWTDRPIVALLAGSRKKEIEGILPSMVRIARDHPDHRFVVAGAPSIDPALYEPYLEGTDIGLVTDETYALLASSRAALVTSGTATLETALLGTPQVVLYRTGRLAYSIAKQIVSINFISLVNLILDRGLVLEVIQKDLYGKAGEELGSILDDSPRRKAILEGYSELSARVGEPGVSERIAGRMTEMLKEENNP